MSVAAVAVGLAVLVGALTQRVTGVGFALVASPLLILLLGPVQGAVITNIFGVSTALVVYLLHALEVEYRTVLPLLGAATLAVIPGALLAHALPSHVMAIGAGSLVVAALCLSVFARRLPGIDGWPWKVGAGGLSGFMNVIAGVGGPAVVAYAVASGWDHRRFAISVQFYFACVGAFSLVARWELPSMSPEEWLAATLALVVGLLGGHKLAQVVPTGAARTVSLILALVGGVAVIAQGVVAA